MATTKFVEPQRTGRGYGAVARPSHEMDWKNPGDEAVIVFIKSQTQQHDERHIEWVRRAKLQLAWAAGDQSKVWDGATQGLTDSFEAYTDRIALFVNRIKPAILNWVSLVTARPLSFRVHPATADDVDISSARVQDKLVRYYWRKLLGDDVFLDALWTMFCTGIAFLRSTWDPMAGSEFAVGAADVMTEEEGKGKDAYGLRAGFKGVLAKLTGLGADEIPIDDQEQFTVNTGDLACDFLDGFSIIAPFRANNIKDSPWMIVREWKHIEEVRARFGKKAEGLHPGYSEPMNLYADYGAMEGWNSTLRTNVRPPEQLGDHVLTYELWRPRRYQGKDKGNLVVISQDRVLKSGPNPYNHGEIPIISMQELPSPKQFWPPSTVEDLMGLQNEINISRTQVANHKAATVEPRIIAEKGCGLDAMAFTEPNEIVEVNPGKINALRPWVPEPLPQYMQWWEMSLRRDFEDLTRNHASSYGKQTGSVKSGRHAVALQEADMRMNAPMFRLLRESFGHTARQWLSILKQFVSEERVITVIGENHEPEVLTWSGQAFSEAEFNVECDLGPPMDRQTTVELIDMMTARGWLRPDVPDDKEMVRRWLGQGVTQQADETHLDRANATFENTAMLRGDLQVVSDGDDDTVHLFEHNQEQKSARYRRALQRDPVVDKKFLAHKIAHERQRLSKSIRQKVAAIEIQQDLMQQAGVMPEPAQPPARSQGAQQSQPMGGRRASSRPPPPGFKKSGDLFVPR